MSVKETDRGRRSPDDESQRGEHEHLLKSQDLSAAQTHCPTQHKHAFESLLQHF